MDSPRGPTDPSLRLVDRDGVTFAFDRDSGQLVWIRIDVRRDLAAGPGGETGVLGLLRHALLDKPRLRFVRPEDEP
jgi:hypothetical protein